MDEIAPRRGRRRKTPLPDVERVVVPGEKPTLRTIALMTGLAITTISRALNNAPELAAETRERVQRIAAEIGYVPDRTALRLKTGRTNVISLILDPHDEILGFGQSMVSGLTEALRGTAYHIVITPNYQAAETVPLSICQVTGVALDPALDWHLDLDGVLAAIRPNTRVISVNFPNNPTGKVLPVEDFLRLGRPFVHDQQY